MKYKEGSGEGTVNVYKVVEAWDKRSSLLVGWNVLGLGIAVTCLLSWFGGFVWDAIGIHAQVDEDSPGSVLLLAGCVAIGVVVARAHMKYNLERIIVRAKIAFFDKAGIELEEKDLQVRDGW